MIIIKHEANDVITSPVENYRTDTVKKEIKRLQLKDEHFSCKIKLSKQMQSKTMYI